MEIIKHNFSWESDHSHQVFWEFQKGLPEQAEREVKQIIQLFNLSNFHKLLDVGCGIGLHIVEFLKKGFDVVGIDISDYVIAKAEANYREAGFQSIPIYNMRASDIPWADEFDLVYAIRHTLGFMTQDELRTHIKKMWDAVKPGGKLLLSIPCPLEMERSKLPVHKWSIQDEKYILVDKFLTDENIKREHCIIINTKQSRIEEYIEEQIYYSKEEIINILNECGVSNIHVLKDFTGNVATDGKEAKVFIGEK